VRTRVLVTIAAICAVSTTADADTAKAKAANTAGYKLHKQKQYKEAAAEYRKAIQEDPDHLLAHYNLACVASLLKDFDTAIAELAWVMDRSTWDPAAKAAFKKARKDKDLKWLVEDTVEGKAAFDAVSADPVTAEHADFGVSKPTKDAAIAKVLGSGAKHEATCSGDVVALPVKMRGSKFFKSTVAASPREGIAVIDAAGSATLRSDPLGCADAKDQVQIVTNAFATSHPFQELTAPLDNQEFIVVVSARGADHHVTMFLPKDKQLVRIFEAPYKTGGKTGSVLVTPMGNLVYVAPGTKAPKLLRFDKTAFKYVD
jgi:hypothetical protein